MTDTTFDPRRTQRLVILQHAGLLTPKHGKTGISLLRYRGDEVVAVIDREAVIAAAVWFSDVRLIDNMLLHPATDTAAVTGM